MKSENHAENPARATESNQGNKAESLPSGHTLDNPTTTESWRSLAQIVPIVMDQIVRNAKERQW